MRWNRGGLAIAAAAGLLWAGCGGSTDSVDRHTLEKEVTTELTRAVGQTPKSVSCPDKLKAKVDATTRCTLTADDGTRFGVTLTVTSVGGGHTKFHIQVDSKPS